ncbi:MAG: homoserine dehydrogenase [Dehalococcoidia bacterium]|nr:homoserine dehydrogenase [Dehalococcoidia bacterium]
MVKDSIGLGLMGLGTVGGGVLEVLTQKAEELARRVDCPLVLKKILVRDLGKQRPPATPTRILTSDFRELLNDPDIDILMEVIGGETDAFDFMRQGLLGGKHIVTANKEVIAKHGAELMRLAARQGLDIRHEASVGGGIPLINPFKEDLAANRISAILAIINGTTNYIVTRMAEDNMDFAAALGEAQRLGYAEPDPANDVEGIDAAYKLAILATLAFRTEIRPENIYHEGISRLSARDFRYARELGYAIKLLAIAKEENDAIEVRVHPAFIPENLLLAKVGGVFNAIQVEGDLTGPVIFYGRGAGALPTASAVIADVVHIAQNVRLGLRPKPQVLFSSSKNIMPIEQIQTRYYMRMTIDDHPGVLAQISRILGDHSISIASVIQKGADECSQSAEIMIMTHPALESAVRQALQETRALPVVREVSNLIRVEG